MLGVFIAGRTARLHSRHSQRNYLQYSTCKGACESGTRNNGGRAGRKERERGEKEGGERGGEQERGGREKERMVERMRGQGRERGSEGAEHVRRCLEENT